MADQNVTDPDVQHLLDLLVMIPGRDNVLFWNRVNAGQYSGDSENEERFIDAGYAVKKIGQYLPRVLRGDAEATADLASYLIMFFDSDSESMRLAVSAEIGHLPSNVLGRLWIEDMITTAWQVYVTHAGSSSRSLWNRDLAAKWAHS